MGPAGTWLCGFDVVDESLASEARGKTVVLDDEGIPPAGSDIIAKPA